MDEMKKMNEALTYIENHLVREVSIEEAAKRAACSEYHFRRIFSYLAGIPVSEYIRRRRLTRAAMDLVHTRRKVIDIAYEYGYHSPDSFTRAFHAMHGHTPSEVRKNNLTVVSYPPMTFRMTIEGGESMNYRMIEKGPFRIAGLGKRVAIRFEGVNPEIEEMWHSLDEEKIEEMMKYSDTEPHGLVSASANFSEGRMEEKGGLDHYIGVATTKPELPHGYKVLEVEEGEWAVFDAVGPFPDTLQETWGRIYSEWFPQSSYELREGPEMLWNEKKNTDASDFRSEIWIPVKKKEEQ